MRKYICLWCMMCCCAMMVSAQGNDPVAWEFSSRKIADQRYEVHISALVEYPWRIYSQHTDEGGPLPTVIAFEDNKAVKLQGMVEEEGSLIEKYEEIFMVNARYYQGKVDFVQQVKVDEEIPQHLAGSVTFMACSDAQCLTPQEIRFKVRLH